MQISDSTQSGRIRKRGPDISCHRKQALQWHSYMNDGERRPVRYSMPFVDTAFSIHLQVLELLLHRPWHRHVDYTLMEALQIASGLLSLEAKFAKHSLCYALIS